MYVARAIAWSCVVASIQGPIGCSGDDAVPEAGPEARGSFAVLLVERARFDGELPSSRYEHFEMSGRVARFSGIERERVAAILGIDGLDEPVELDSCDAPTALSLADDVAVEEMGRAEIDLVDVGPIDVRAGSRSLRLEPQSFPGLLDVLSGAVYGADEREGIEWSSGADYSFLAGGALDIGSFEAVGSAPDELVVLRVGGDDPTLGTAAIERQLDLLLRWEPGDQRDTLRVDLTWSQLGTEMRLECNAIDDGAFVIPASVLRQVPEGAFAVSPRVTMHRVRRRSFAAPGLDEGVLLFEQSETFPVRIR
ncbi:MAG: hypothetical protein HYY06_26930 [Deltaproteobacteria bacterium]|nr:hypothetical protein [Deltaproteobacteria bacterium]